MTPLAQFDTETLDAADALFARPCVFMKGVVNVAGLPEDTLPEVAFAGRSNVGKSSLLNALVGRKALARTSNTPGRTREVNYFLLDGRAYLVDLPGYGYARAAKTEVAGWNRLIRNYLQGRASLRRVFLLIDARHGLKESDKPTLELMDASAVSYQGVLTKSDKVKAGELEKVIERTAKELSKHPAAYPQIIATSARKGAGLPELRAAILTLMRE
ncbi:MAG TPA: YihA family ribosome biogenesis GTP-binding protein [Rhizobiales bacterium]|nr:putative GTP-binding protein EngB [bacterium BMS3Bbin10]HDO51495.1 YihA family ribosome biogenesis GTP-binding protein [Hyphomicrobiales bacterium]